jgi:DNA-binding CsgD family transcriptional regulator
MGRRLDDLLERLGEAKDRAGLNEAVVALRDGFETDHVVYHAVRSCGAQWGALTYDARWVDAYLAENLQTVDPVVLSCFGRAAPVDWKRLDWSPRPARALLGEALANGLGNQGLSLPIHGPGGRFAIFTVNARGSDDAWARFGCARIEDVLLAAHYVNERAMAIEGIPAPEVRGLSPRETDVLSLLATGLSRARAAERLEISEHTLRAYIESARLKLGALNTTHAVASALSRGLIGL